MAGRESDDMNDETGDATGADALARAEAQAAQAEERAAQARAKAVEARRRADSGAAADHVADDTAPAGDSPAPAPAGRRPVRAGRVAAVVVAALLICGLIGASAAMVVAHRNVERDRERAAQFSAAARQGVINLMAINYNTAEADIQRVIDNATGQFRDDFKAGSGDLAKALHDGKIITDVDVKSVAVESMTDQSAVVLVSTVSQRGKTDAPDRDPRTWRAVVTVQRDGDQLKIAKLEFA